MRIRRPEYPCTLKECCDANPGPAGACCPRNYTRLYGRLPACGSCSRDASGPPRPTALRPKPCPAHAPHAVSFQPPYPGPDLVAPVLPCCRVLTDTLITSQHPLDPTCRPFEESEIPPWSARGPAQASNQQQPAAATPAAANRGTGWLKPDLVAPGTALAANSDGNTNTAADGEEYGVQCGRGANATTSECRTTSCGCDVLAAAQYSAAAAMIQKTGTSVSAALVAGAALVVRQYLADGFYPSGVRLPARQGVLQPHRNSSHPEWGRPPAALVKALLIQSAQSVGGRTTTHTYYPDPDPLCQELQDDLACPPLLRKTRDLLGATPNMIEGFGRPRLDSVLWFADSQWSLWLTNAQHPTQGRMHTYTFKLLKSDARGTPTPFKVTLCYTDAPAAPGASQILVNDLDLIIQRETVDMVLNTSIGRKVSAIRSECCRSVMHACPVSRCANTASGARSPPSAS